MSLEPNGCAQPLNCAGIDESVFDGSAPRIPGLLRRLRANRAGVVAAEFAIVSPVLLGLLFGTIEYGLALFSYSSMQTAARDVARQVAVNSLSFAGAPAELKSRLPAWMRNQATITLTQTTPANPATNVYTATVSVPMASATPLNFFTTMSSGSLRTEVEMKQELPFVEPPK